MATMGAGQGMFVNVPTGSPFHVERSSLQLHDPSGYAATNIPSLSVFPVVQHMAPKRRRVHANTGRYAIMWQLPRCGAISTETQSRLPAQHVLYLAGHQPLPTRA